MCGGQRAIYSSILWDGGQNSYCQAWQQVPSILSDLLHGSYQSQLKLDQDFPL
ncbi:hypothetical protein I79_007516 [Cricetulus griseus]|uniref:Uncharacterized protein n=1 Tax=Cricetulus griseus TaxID=10029 RepID=G3HAQ8_CRIGR|nr:hypothetical protein I79_007516 [Cricetulus griseus]